jgi:RHS repeat-associated protein
MKTKLNIDFRATTTSRQIMQRRAKKTLRYPLFQRGLGGFSSKFTILDRGYCGHEHLLEHGIINMNGRIYDPVVGQFMQADNYIQTPEDYIGYNRYAYCRYNPFKYVDPSGEEFLENPNKNDGGGSVTGPPSDPIVGCDPKPDGWVDPPGPVRISVMDGNVTIYGPGTSLFGNRGPNNISNQITTNSPGNGGGFRGESSGQGCGIYVANAMYNQMNAKLKINDDGKPTQQIPEKTKKASEYVAPWIIGGSLMLTTTDWAAVGSFIVAGLPAALILLTTAIPSSTRIPGPYESRGGTNVKDTDYQTWTIPELESKLKEARKNKNFELAERLRRTLKGKKGVNQGKDRGAPNKRGTKKGGRRK